MAMGQLDLPITREEKLALADALLACLVKLDNLAERQAEEKARMRNERKKLETEIARIVQILRASREIESAPDLPFDAATHIDMTMTDDEKTDDDDLDVEVDDEDEVEDEETAGSDPETEDEPNAVPVIPRRYVNGSDRK